MIPQKRISSWLIPVLVFFFLFGDIVKEARALTTEEEKKLGKQIFLEIDGKVGIVRDLSIQALLDRVGHCLVAQVGPTPFEFRFYLVKGADPNAFAVPGGYVFVTTGLIVMADNENEIAGVLCHEIAHITGRHISQMIERSKRLSLASLAAIIAGAAAGRGGPATGATVAMATGLAEANILKFTREMEAEADQNGLHYLLKSGYDPKGLMDFLNKIQKFSLASMPNVPAYLLTHPETESRTSLLENLLQLEAKTTGPFRVVGDLRKVKARAFVEEREPNVAVSHFESIVKGDPQDINAYYGLGLAYRKMGRLDKSMEVLQSAHSLAPKDPDISREIGIAYFFSGKLDQALESIGAVLRDQNDDLLSRYYLGRAYQEEGDFASALPLFLKVQREMPDFVEVYYSLGSAYGRTGQKGLSHFYFGKHFKWKGESNNALLHFRTALEWLDRGSSERDEAQREIKELTLPKQSK